MPWKTTLKKGDKLVIGGGTVITVNRKTIVSIASVAGTTAQRVEKIEAERPDPVQQNGGGPEFWDKP